MKKSEIRENLKDLHPCKKNIQEDSMSRVKKGKPRAGDTLLGCWLKVEKLQTHQLPKSPLSPNK